MVNSSERLKVTIIAATQLELRPLFDHFRPQAAEFSGLYIINEELHILITGMGMLNTAAHLSLYTNRYDRDYFIDAGICGAFNRNLKIGEVVQIISETYGDFGVENDEQFEDFYDLGFLDKKEDAYQYGLCYPIVHPQVKELPYKKVTSITVNKVHGNAKTIEMISKKYNADTENMEGLAFYYVLKLIDKPGIEVRSISNYVEKRNKDNWDIKSAVSKLNTALLNILSSIHSIE